MKTHKIDDVTADVYSFFLIKILKFDFILRLFGKNIFMYKK